MHDLNSMNIFHYDPGGNPLYGIKLHMNRQWLKITSCYVGMFSILYQWHMQQTEELTENFTHRKYQENENRAIPWKNAS